VAIASGTAQSAIAASEALLTCTFYNRYTVKLWEISWKCACFIFWGSVNRVPWALRSCTSLYKPRWC